MSASTTPIMSSTDFNKPPVVLTHYLVAAYDSAETFRQHVVVIDPSLAEPTWVLRPRATKPTRRNIICLAVPNLESLTLSLAQELTNVVTDYITVREFPQVNRQRGVVKAGPIVPTPWL